MAGVTKEDDRVGSEREVTMTMKKAPGEGDT